MNNHRPGSGHFGPGRAFAARIALLLTVSFLVASAGIAALTSLGLHPIGTR
jgi:hypothetical protein